MIALLKRLFGLNVDDSYFERFFDDTVRDMLLMGIPQSDIDRLVKQALDTPDPTVIGLAPGTRLRNFLGMLKDGITADEIVERKL